MHNISVFVGFGNEVKNSAGRIDDRSRDDPYLSPSRTVSVLLNASGDCGRSCGAVGEAGGPQRPGIGVVGIEGVHAIMHRRNVDNVMHTLARDVYSGKVQWMPHNETVHW